MMTERQSQALEFITSYTRTYGGVSPTFEEIRRGLNLSSKSQVHNLVRGLEERGFIRTLKHKMRAIEIVKRQRYAVFVFDPELKDLRPYRPATHDDILKLKDGSQIERAALAGGSD